MSRKRGFDDVEKSTLAPSPDRIDDEDDSIFRSSPIEDRTSTFVAVFSPMAGVKSLQATHDFKSASHRMVAWRLLSKQRSLTPDRPVYESGHDDDGEQYGGRKLERLLDRLGIVGTVVVARWYGGILLGPVRFEHIENCAKQAIQQWQQARPNAPGSDSKRPKLEGPATSVQPTPNKAGEEAVRAIKIKTLERRDNSIVALRGLLAEKQGRVGEPAQAESRPAPKYERMNVATLQKMEGARDKTIAWILEEIDKAEGKQEATDSAQGISDAGPIAEGVSKPTPQKSER